MYTECHASLKYLKATERPIGANKYSMQSWAFAQSSPFLNDDIMQGYH